MVHLILLLPIIGLVVFWVLPLSIALPAYLVLLGISGIIYYLAIRSTHRPTTTGKDGLIGKSVLVTEISAREMHVRVDGEIWRATSNDLLRSGENAVIVGIDGLTLKVAKQPVRQDKPHIDSSPT